jgi:non-ribosomal peptide synthetase component F
MRRLQGHYLSVLRGVIQNPDTAVGELPLLAPDEVRAVLQNAMGAVKPVAECLCIHHLIEERAASHPDSPAVACNGHLLRYGELNSRANRLARALRGRGIRPEKTVGICCSRSEHVIIAMTGILKSGGAYVPLDPSLPAERMRSMVEQANVTVIVALREHETVLRHLGSGGELQILLLDDENDELTALPSTNLRLDVSPDNAA